MPTKNDENKNNGHKSELTPAQLTAVDCLALGATITDAAKSAKVSRQTVSEWLNQYPNFQVALNLRRRELWEEQKDRLRGLMPRALERIEKALASEGPEGLRAALALAKIAKIDLTPTGGIDRDEIEVEEAERESRLRMRRLSAAWPASIYE